METPGWLCTGFGDRRQPKTPCWGFGTHCLLPIESVGLCVHPRGGKAPSLGAICAPLRSFLGSHQA